MRFKLTLKREQWSNFNSIKAIKVLVKCGLSMKSSKDFIERLTAESAGGLATFEILLPKTISKREVVAHLYEAGV